MQVFSVKIENGIERINSANLYLSNSTNGVSKMTKSILPPRSKSIKICSIENCAKKYMAKGLCMTHYSHLRSYGTAQPSKNTGIGSTPKERFWSKVEKTETCWLWTGAISKRHGYGKFGYKHKDYRAHRIAWFFLFGEMPSDNLLHSCDNRRCVNPEHLREGTYQDNADDMVSRSRQAFGENHGNAVLTNDEVRQIRKLLKEKIRGTKIAEMFGVANYVISKIKRGVTYSLVK